MRIIIDTLLEYISKGYFLIFINNILFASNIAKEYSRLVRAVMDSLWKNSFTLKDRKYIFR
jgi:hypothetical protein